MKNFQRKLPGRNNHNAAKLIEKYNNLAREALSSGDKILSENYFQHADHFTRISNEQDIKKKYNSSNNIEEKPLKDSVNTNEEKIELQEKKFKNKLNQFKPIIFSDFKTFNLIFFVSKIFLSSPFNILPEGSFKV